MSVDLQKTIAKDVNFEGIGLHTGKKVKVICKPAQEERGIVFTRKDLFPEASLKVSPEKVIFIQRHSALKNGRFFLRSVEHFLSALYGLGLDNIIVEINGEEIPSLDGSALSYIKIFKKAGIVKLNKCRRYLTFEKPLYLKKGLSFFLFVPSARLKITYFLDFPGKSLPLQSAVYEEGISDYEEEIAPARTFGFWEEIPRLWENSFALGGSLDSAVLISVDGSFSSPLKFNNEFARHKILDLLGDFYLSGYRIKADITAIRTSHSFHAQILKDLLPKG